MEIHSSLSLETEEGLNVVKIETTGTERDPKDVGDGAVGHNKLGDTTGRPYKAKIPSRSNPINKPQKFYQCDQSPCTKLYPDPWKLKTHKIKAHGVGEGSSPIQCPHCRKILPNKPSFQQHLRNVHNLKGSFLACPACSNKFVGVSGLVRHVRFNRSTSDCPYCTESFNWKCGLKQHLEFKCNNLNLPCPTCPRKFPNRRKLWDHRGNCKQGKPDPCPHCGKQYKNFGDLQKHIRISHNKDKDTTCGMGTPPPPLIVSPTVKGDPGPGHQISYTCLHCAYDFENKRKNLERHLKLMLPKRKGDQFSCSSCLVKFDVKCRLKIHQRIQKCQARGCSYGTCCENLFKEHSEKCTGTRKHNGIENLIKLEEIGTLVLEDEEILQNPDDDSALPTPIIVIGSRETSGQTFTSSRGLSKLHAKPNTINTKPEKLYQCDQTPCKKLYPTTNALRIHKVRAHGIGEGASPIQCPYCPKIISSKPNYRDHIRRVHKLKESNLVCPGCSTKFLEDSGLFRHVRLNQRSSNCPHCTESFNWKCGLKIHLKLKCSNLCLPCPSCHKLFPNYARLWVHKRVCQQGIPDFKGAPTGQGEPRPRPKISYTCLHCAHDFKNYRTNLERHLKLMLPKRKGVKFSCSSCLEKFDAKCALQVHQRIQKCPARGAGGGCSYALLCDTLFKEHLETCTGGPDQVPFPEGHGNLIKLDLEEIETMVLEGEEKPPNAEENIEGDELPLPNYEENIDEDEFLSLTETTDPEDHRNLIKSEEIENVVLEDDELPRNPEDEELQNHKEVFVPEFLKESLPLTCPHCQQKFTREISLHRHLNMNRADKGSARGTELHCQTCDQKFNFKCEKVKHICNAEDSIPVSINKSPMDPLPSESEINQDESGGPFYCWACNIAFRLKLQFFQHIRQIHNEEPSMS